MSTEFVAYIDESGDEGFTFRDDGSGSSRWLVLSALVMRRVNDPKVVETAREARELLRKPPRFPLHFRDLKHEQRVALARLIGQMPSRTVSVLIHKPSIPEQEHFQQEAYSLYRYASRLLLERVSWLCRDHRRDAGEVELIFSNRSAMSYDALRGYLVQLRQEAERRDVRIEWPLINPDKVRAVNHDQLAGLQLADAVATSVYYAVTPNLYGDIEDRYFRLVGPTIYCHERRAEGYGLKFWVTDRTVVARLLAALNAA
ncbi:DUF3800 domain-containing protein [Lysobacter cavernae]|uniref:DUF3800 domain-containing protein n=1 Tax=Lysobacter cavernae TaxID=1685901 RepID=A0ABV7RNB6_9GAMM